MSMYCSVVSATALQATVRAYAVVAGCLLACSCVFSSFVRFVASGPGIVIYVVANLLIAGVAALAAVNELRPRAALLPPFPPPPPGRRHDRRPALAAAVVDGVESKVEGVPTVLPADDVPADRGWAPVEWRSPDRPIAWDPPERPRSTLPPVE